jgi:enoyl-CoA hydratase/carnithine racemase
MTTTASFQYLALDKYPNNIYVITLKRGTENKMTVDFCQEIIRAFHTIHKELGANGEGAVITRGSNEKFWSTGIQLDDPNPWTSADGFFPVRLLLSQCLGSGVWKKEKIADRYL